MSSYTLSPDITWKTALAGGCILAVTSSLNLLLNGEITGISGLLNGILTWKPNHLYRIGFMGGLLATGGILCCSRPELFRLDTIPPLTHAALILSGFLVGFGTVMGSGCTSGHGICGLPRLSPRSFVAVGTFMATGAMTAALVTNVDALNSFARFSDAASSLSNLEIPYGNECVTSLGILAATWAIIKKMYCTDCGCEDAPCNLKQVIVSVVFGGLFAIAMVISGMVQQEKVLNFLWPGKNGWDPSLMFVMGGGVGLNLVFFNLILRKFDKPVFKAKFEVPPKGVITPRLIGGAALFGIGWGLGGICPAPGLVNLGTGRLGFFVWSAAVCFGMVVFNFLDEAIKTKNK